MFGERCCEKVCLGGVAVKKYVRAGMAVRGCVRGGVVVRGCVRGGNGLKNNSVHEVYLLHPQFFSLSRLLTGRRCFEKQFRS